MNNDLISRSALKEEFAKHEDRKGYLIGDWEEFIDNAPTIEPITNEEIKSAIDEGFKNGYEMAKAKFGRPKGEWIIDGHHYKCSRCGKTLAIMFSETDDDDLIGCPFCLADMRVKGERPQTISCFNCKHDYKSAADEPCKYCEKHCEWQAKGGRE